MEFKLKAVKLSQLPGIEVQAVADALEIHPFHAVPVAEGGPRGHLRGRVSVPKALKPPPARDVKRFQALKRAQGLLPEEPALVKRLIRFTAARRPPSSRSSNASGTGSA